jgi:hypothetical protein
MASNQMNKQSGPRQSNDKNQGRPRSRSREESEQQEDTYQSRVSSQLHDFTDEQPGTALLLALGAGLGVGLLIGMALQPPQPRRRTLRDRFLAEGLGRRLLERAESLLPDAVAERLNR